MVITKAHTQNWQLVWSDEFDGEISSDWIFDIGNGCPDLCGWGNNELQYYREENATVEDGKLVITGKKENYDGFEYTSAKLKTEGQVFFQYGRLEASIKLPAFQGSWPAFWTLGENHSSVGWPACGEIDIMEQINTEMEIHGHIHWQHDGGHASTGGSTGDVDVTDFNVYAIEWDKEEIRWFVNDNHYFTADISEIEEFHKPHYLILNMAIGGSWPGHDIDDSALPAQMEVEYVRVYQQPEYSIIDGPGEVAPGQANVVFSSKITANKYTWDVPENVDIISGENTDSITVNWSCDPGTIYLTLETDSDTTTIEHSVSIIPVELKGKSIVHPKETDLLYSIPELTAGVYNWSFPDDVTVTGDDTSNSIYLNWGCTDGSVELNYSSICIQDEESVNMPVTIKTPSITGPSTIEENAENINYRIEAILNSTYQWTVPDNVTITDGQETTSITTNWGDTGGTVRIDVENQCGTTSDELEVTISEDEHSTIICDFETVILDFYEFGGAVFEQVENPYSEGINTSDQVGMSYKREFAQGWGGIYADLPYMLDFDTYNIISMDVYAPKEGIILFKLEHSEQSVETEIGYDLTTTNEWTTVYYDFSEESADTYNRITLFFDFGNTYQDIYYFDNIRMKEPLAEHQLTVNVDPDDAGIIIIDPEQDYYNMNSVITLTAEADAENGFVFVDWEGDTEHITGGSVYSKEITITMPDRDVELTANFENDPTLSETEHYHKHTLEVYPAIADNFINVKMKNLYHVKVYNIAGVVIISKVADGDKIRLDVSDLNSGIYIIKAENNVRKFIKR